MINNNTIEHLFRSKYKYYLKVAYNLCNDSERAKDVVSAAFLHILCYKEKIPSAEQCSKFITHIIKQRWFVIYRKEIVEKTCLNKLTLNSIDQQPDRVALYPASTRLVAKVKKLPLDQKTIIKATFWEGLDGKEISKRYGIKLNSIPQIRSRALNRLKRIDPGKRLDNQKGRSRPKKMSKETLLIVDLIKSGLSYKQVAGKLKLTAEQVKKRFYHYRKKNPEIVKYTVKYFRTKKAELKPCLNRN